MVEEAGLAQLESALASPWLGAVFVGLILAVAAAQRVWPAYPAKPAPPGRLRTNLGIGCAMLASQFAAAGLLAVLLARFESRRFGLLSLIEMSPLVHLLIGVGLISLIGYWAHRLAHHWQWLWRIHRVHHCDTRLDVTSVLRHHPFEAVLSVAAGGVFAILLGLSAAAVLLEGALVFALGIFQHADLAFPKRADRILRIVLATPAMHHVHHSPEPARTNSNYGDVFSFWDRLFGTYCPPASAGEAGIGLGGDADLNAHDWKVQLRSPFGS